MFGTEYKTITVVALVRNIDHSSTKITYELEDLTGRIMGNFWIDENESNQQSIQLNTYVRVVGSIRAQSDVRAILIYKIYPISGVNELNTHLLEVLNARYMSEEYANNGGGNSTLKEGGLHHESKMEVDNTIGDDMEGLKGKDRAVLELIRNFSQSDEGCTRSEIQNRFPHIPPREIATILDSMITNGHIYTTLDADHFQACF